MSVETEFAPTDAPVAKLLSVILIIGQVVAALAVIILLIATISVSLPETMNISIKTGLAEKLPETVIFGTLLSAVVIAVGWFFVLHFLRKVVRTLIHGDPFSSPENINRLRLILILIIATELVRIATVFFHGSAGETEQVMRLDIRIGTWFFIFIIAAISATAQR